MKYMKQFREWFSGRVFSASDVKRFLVEKGAGIHYAKLLLHNLAARGELRRIGRGFYSFGGADSGIDAAFYPAYHGLQDALSLYGAWGQATNQVIITPRKVRAGEREILGRKVLVRRISRKMFFGHTAMRLGGGWLNVSEPEKTIVDFFYFREPLGRHALKNLLRKSDRKRLLLYLKKAGKRTERAAMKAMGKKPAKKG